MLTTILVILTVLILFLAAFLLFRTATWGSTPEPVDPIEVSEIDDWTVAEHLSRLIQLPTISYDDPARFNAKAFLSLHKELESMYPRLHRTLQVEKVNEYSLLYTWVGTNPELKPILLMSHIDVVPVDDDSDTAWTHPPFSGEIADGFVWGRGAQDIKSGVICTMESVECLLVEGYKPERTIYLAYGHDEELSGRHGAGAIVSVLKKRGVELEAVIDEGGAIFQSINPWVEGPVAMVGIGEKGFLSLVLTAETTGGHSAVPPRDTAIGKLSRAIARLEAHPMPYRLGPIISQLRPLSSELPFFFRVALANQWLFSGLLRSQLAADPKSAALVHTTTAPTMLSAGIKDNILPRQARAVINFRLLPGDSVLDVVHHLRKTIDDPEIQISPLYEDPLQRLASHGEKQQPADDPERIQRWGREAPPISDPEGPGYKMLETTIRQLYPDVLVTSALSTGATDARYYSEICPQVFRFMPFRFGPDDLRRIHGIDERMSIKNLGDGVRFFMAWIKKF